MLKIVIGEKQNFLSVYRRFQRMCYRAHIVKRSKELMYYEKPTTTRRKARIAALRRNYVRYKLPHLQQRLA